MSIRRGDVVIIDYPFTDGSGTKVRPALIVQSDERNERLPETIIAFITRNLTHLDRDVTQMLIDVSAPDGQSSGLNANSAVKCGKLFTVHKSLIRRRIGSLGTTLMRAIDYCLKKALSLP